LANSGTLENFQDTHIWGASRGHLCSSSAFLLPRDATHSAVISRTVRRLSVRPSVCRPWLSDTYTWHRCRNMRRC